VNILSLIGVFRLLTFDVITDTVGLLATILIAVFYVPLSLIPLLPFVVKLFYVIQFFSPLLIN
jgi:hypothetical protein